MKKNILLLLLFPFYCLAQQVPAYYSGIDFTLTGNSLKDQLAVLITATHTNELVYTPEVWNALKQADVDPENGQRVLLIYGYNDNDADTDNDRSRDKDMSCHTTSCNGRWVREHVYPRSLGDPNLEYEGPGSDAHHLRSIDYNMNSSRSNRRFAAGSGNATTLPGGLFYPGDEWKGDVARMMMYMYVRYQSRCQALVVGAGSATYSDYADMPNIFLEWNAQDPVNEYERNRNTVLENMQGNRNPFIDNPYLATLLWNGPTAQDTWGILSSYEIALNNVVIYPTITTGTVYIKNDENRMYSYNVYNSLGQQVNVAIADNTINLNNNAKGMYYLAVKDGNASKTFKIILN